MQTSNRVLLGFLAITFLLSWIPVALLGLTAPESDGAQQPTAWVVAALVYLGTFGWQPLVALFLVRGWRPSTTRGSIGLLPARRAYVVAAAAIPVALGFAGILFASALGTSDSHGAPVRESQAFPDAVFAVPAFVAATLLIEAQCIAEEIAWRGFFLAALMARVGTRSGLIVHGILWGLWYAPVAFLTLGGAQSGLLAPLSAIVTCGLIGGLLGWLRIASGSLVPPIIANSVLTTFAGIPLVLRGIDVGGRSAIIEPAGWIPLALLLALLLAGPGRRALRSGRVRRDAPRQISAAVTDDHGRRLASS